MDNTLIYYDKNLNFLRRSNHDMVLNAKETLDINKYNELSVELVKGEFNEDVRYIGVRNMNGVDFNIYAVQSFDEDEETDLIECIDFAIDDLRFSNTIKDKRPTGSLERIFKEALDGSVWTLRKCPKVEGTVENFYYISNYEAIQNILKSFDVDVYYSVELDDNNEISKYNVDVLETKGRQTQLRFTHGENVLKINRQVERQDIITRAIGRGKGEEKDSGSYGRRLEFTDVVWSKEKGDPVDKPKGQNWVEIPNATKLYPLHSGKARRDVLIFEQEEDVKKLLKSTYNQLVKLSVPKIEYAVDVINVKKVLLADRVTVTYHDRNWAVESKVHKIERDLLDERLSKFYFGHNFSKSSYKDTIKLIEDKIKPQLDDIQTQIENESGNTISHGGEQPPETAKDGDTWFTDVIDQQTGEVTSQIWVYNGETGTWERKDWGAEANRLKEEIDKQKEEISKALDGVDDNNQKWEENSKGLETVKNEMVGIGGEVSTIKQNVEGIQTTVQNKADKSEVTQLVGQITSVVEDVEGNKSQITQLKDNINLKVDKDKVISQINVSPENILIQSKKIILDGDTTVKGTAWLDGAVMKNATITNAKISSLDASKLTSGSIKTGTIFIKSRLDIAENGTLNGSYDYKEDIGEAYLPRSYVGDWQQGIRLLRFVGVTKDERTGLKHDTRTYFGQDQVKLRTVDGITEKIQRRIDLSTFKEPSLVMWADKGLADDQKSEMTAQGLQARMINTRIVADRTYMHNGKRDLSEFLYIYPSSLSKPEEGNSGFAIRRNNESGKDVWDVRSDYIGNAVGGGMYEVLISQNNYMKTSRYAYSAKTLDVVKNRATFSNDNILNGIENLTPSLWKPKDEDVTGETKKVRSLQSKLKMGYTVEDFVEAGMENCLIYDNDGNASDYNVRMMLPYIFESMKDMKNKIDELENKLNG